MEAFVNNVTRVYKMIFGSGKPRAKPQANPTNDPGQYNVSSADMLASAGAKWASVKGLQSQTSMASIPEQRPVSSSSAEQRPGIATAGDHGIPELLRLLVGAGKRDTAMVEVRSGREGLVARY